MPAKIEYEIIDHGCDGEQYFPGCGTSFTGFTDCATGIGDSAREAAMDAAEQMAMSVTDVPADLDNDIAKMSDDPSFDPDDPDIGPEWHHYVSIRWRVVGDR